MAKETIAPKLEQWLDAREAETMRSAWRALAPCRHELLHSHRKITPHGAAMLAASMTGERADWLTTIDTSRNGTRPDHEWGGESSDRCFDDVLEGSSRLNEWWKLYERRTSARGVQLVAVDISETYPPYEGGVIRAVRIFDGDRAASITLDSNRVSTIGDVDLAPLDLFEFSLGFELTPPDDDVATASHPSRASICSTSLPPLRL